MKKIMTLIICITLIMTSQAVLAFDDTNDVPWAEDAIDTLTHNGVINGYEDGTFRPYNNVTRAEFAKMLYLTFASPDNAEQNVLEHDHWARFYIDNTHHLVYTPGDSYEPDRSATRAEIAYALAKALNFEASNADMNNKFSDWDSVDTEISKLVAASVEQGIIEGYENGEIRGADPVTRAETAVLIVRAMNHQNETETPGQDENEPEPAPEENPTDNKNDIFAGLDHIYTVYPYEDLFIISDIATVISDKAGEVAYKLTYKKAGGDSDEYTSVIEEDDTTVSGVKNELSKMAPGDIFIVEMTFLTKIDNICVLASFDNDFEIVREKMVIPVSGDRLGAYDSGADYEFLYGELVEKKIKNNSTALTLKNGSGTYTVNVLRTVSADVLNKGRKGLILEEESVMSLDEDEKTMVYIRFTNGKATEVVASQY